MEVPDGRSLTGLVVGPLDDNPQGRMQQTHGSFDRVRFSGPGNDSAYVVDRVR